MNNIRMRAAFRHPASCDDRRTAVFGADCRPASRSGAKSRRALVLLDANPLDGLETLRHPRAVIAGGRVLDRDALDSMEADLMAAGR